MDVIFLLCSLSLSWGTFCMVISLALNGVPNFEDVVGSLLTEEIRKNSMDYGKHDVALNAKKCRK